MLNFIKINRMISRYRNFSIFTRDRSYSAYMPWQFRLSVGLSVTRVDQPKTVEARITQFSPYSSPIPLVFRGKFHPEILRGSPQAGASNKGGVGKISHFLPLSVNISKTVPDTAKVTIND